MTGDHRHYVKCLKISGITWNAWLHRLPVTYTTRINTGSHMGNRWKNWNLHKWSICIISCISVFLINWLIPPVSCILVVLIQTTMNGVPKLLFVNCVGDIQRLETSSFESFVMGDSDSEGACPSLVIPCLSKHLKSPDIRSCIVQLHHQLTVSLVI